MSSVTSDLEKILQSADAGSVGEVIREHVGSMFGDDAFSSYVRQLIREHGTSQLDVFRRADFSEKYGYAVLSGEKHTIQRDYILRICLAGKFTLDETQRVLKLYGVSPLYARVPRDAMLISAISSGVYDIEKVCTLLAENGFEPLHSSRVP